MQSNGTSVAPVPPGRADGLQILDQGTPLKVRRP